MAAVCMFMITSNSNNAFFMAVSAEEEVVDMDEPTTVQEIVEDVKEEVKETVDEAAAAAEAAAAEAAAKAAKEAEELKKKTEEAAAAAAKAAKEAAAKAAEEAAKAAEEAAKAAEEAVNSVIPDAVTDGIDGEDGATSPAVMAIVNKAKNQITGALERVKEVSTKDAKKIAAGVLGVWGAASVTGWAMQNIAGGGAADAAAAPKP
eukprot:CAMPEP_0185731238 /NCGR_PEP_ID=MMETSP1171-20130828/12313_1 /TAXON_ID=374046 /ORGANISM="Helicotheca tamensis, Strain CCMP826" /LENGTH=204 /DNA_ID=CAMNT_0028400463 /DNA_START=153 /DNA_END=767 /DNA_ORIENTATION=+